MNRLPMTSAASALLRALLARAGEQRSRILLSDWTTTDWQSLTFVGERHRVGLVVSGPQPLHMAEQWAAGLPEAEFDLGSAGFVAEIALREPPALRDDGCVLVQLEALTIAD